MDQSESNKIEIPKRKITLELIVGFFSLLSLAAAAYLSINLGGLELNSTDKYIVNAAFDNVSGLKYGASVEIAGVPIGEVVNISLDDAEAIVKMKINKAFKLRDDDIASIRTKGIIGDRYVKISPGASDIILSENDTLTETESVVDIEDVIGKIVHNMGSSDE